MDEDQKIEETTEVQPEGEEVTEVKEEATPEAPVE